MNDSTVSVVDFDTVRNDRAYLLFYSVPKELRIKGPRDKKSNPSPADGSSNGKHSEDSPRHKRSPDGSDGASR